MTFSTSRRVEFRDTDAAGIVHFSAYFTIMEAAEHEMLRSLGIAVLPQGEEAVTWPRVAATCNYRSAARFDDLLEISVRVARIGASSVQYQFGFRRGEERIADGTLTVVCCRVTARGGFEKATIPNAIRERLAQHQ